MRAVLLVFCATLLTAQTPAIKKVPVTPSSPVSGKDMFAHYCAVCHGVDAKGKGPAAAALKVPPTDLTRLTAVNKGKFPEDRIFSILDGKTQIAAHGTSDMPIWGELFGSLLPGREDVVHLRIVNLTDHLKSLQK